MLLPITNAAAALPWNTCPVHGWHGCPRCPKCCTGTDPDVAVAHPPIVLQSGYALPHVGYASSWRASA